MVSLRTTKAMTEHHLTRQRLINSVINCRKSGSANSEYTEYNKLPEHNRLLKLGVVSYI